MTKLNISLLESIYLIYMFLFFKTISDFNIVASPKHWFLDHSTNNYKENKICPFGKIIIFVFIGILISRHFIKLPKYTIHTSIIIGFILSLMNLNALVYILPVIVNEGINIYI